MTIKTYFYMKKISIKCIHESFVPLHICSDGKVMTVQMGSLYLNFHQIFIYPLISDCIWSHDTLKMDSLSWANYVIRNIQFCIESWLQQEVRQLVVWEPVPGTRPVAGWTLWLSQKYWESGQCLLGKEYILMMWITTIKKWLFDSVSSPLWERQSLNLCLRLKCTD